MMPRNTTALLLLALLGPLPAQAVAADYKMNIDGATVRLGPSVLGPVKDSDLKGRVVLIEFWGVRCPHCVAALPALNALYRELGPQGLVLVGSHWQQATAQQVKAHSLALGVSFPVVEWTKIAGVNDIDGMPHVLLFDHLGRCVYRGKPGGAAPAARKAVRAYLADVKGKALGAEVVALAASLRGDDGELSGVLAQAIELTGSHNARTAADAKVLVAHLTAAAAEKLALAQKQSADQPLEAHDMAAGIAAAFAGSDVATQASGLVGKLKANAAVAAELKARPALLSIQKLDAALLKRAKADTDLAGVAFHKANSFPIRQLRNRVEALRKAAPKARATAEALRIAAKYGIDAD